MHCRAAAGTRWGKWLVRRAPSLAATLWATPLNDGRRLPPHGTAYPHTDFAAIARAAGARGIRVEKPAEVRDALREAFAHDGPVLVDVVTDPDALAIPPKITAEQVTGFALSASRTVLTGGVGRMVHLARANLRNVPRP
ncbi:thiamine pyrophosphate-dependent enzyme [Streptomyces ipomoeae]|nr:thiamine pyrophosphate-dependent enzyme [Streptomyces ipomoeae]MDX2698871.1 thiamine pyrophosphate-dependent enzyme [Streptomyces ipomoeae]MDX2844534.1 thiamine pyrophosphate-dependent enzyme [Streptomyces ipomoeae]